MMLVHQQFHIAKMDGRDHIVQPHQFVIVKIVISMEPRWTRTERMDVFAPVILIGLGNIAKHHEFARIMIVMEGVWSMRVISILVVLVHVTAGLVGKRVKSIQNLIITEFQTIIEEEGELGIIFTFIRAITIMEQNIGFYGKNIRNEVSAERRKDIHQLPTSVQRQIGIPVGRTICQNLTPFLIAPICNIHDCCYGTCGATKAHCDAIFAEGVKTVCSFLTGTERKACNAVASVKLTLIKHVGAKAFKHAQNKFCHCSANG